MLKVGRTWVELETQPPPSDELWIVFILTLSAPLDVYTSHMGGGARPR